MLFKRRLSISHFKISHRITSIFNCDEMGSQMWTQQKDEHKDELK